MFKAEAQAQTKAFEKNYPFPIGNRQDIEVPEENIVSVSIGRESDDQLYLTLASTSFVIGPLRLNLIAAERLRFDLCRLAPEVLRL